MSDKINKIRVKGITYSISDEEANSRLDSEIQRATSVEEKLQSELGTDQITLIQGGIDEAGNESSNSYFLRTSKLSNFKLEVNSEYTIGQLVQYDLGGNFITIYNDYQELEGITWSKTSISVSDRQYLWIVTIFKGTSPSISIHPSENVVKSFLSGLYLFAGGGVEDNNSSASKAKEIVNNTIEQLPNEEDLVILDDKLQFANRYSSDNVSLCYIILRPNKSFKDQVIESNTIYEIRYEFDLEGEEIEIPENCTLKFEGGKLSNGTVIGNNTKISGNILINKLRGTFTDKILSTYSDLEPNYYKLSMLCSLGVETLVLDENFEIENHSTIIVNKLIKNLSGKQTVINIKSTTKGSFISITSSINISAISLDFNNNSIIGQALGIKNTKDLIIDNVNILNIKNSIIDENNNPYVFGIFIYDVLEDCNLNIKNCEFKNITSIGNNVVTDLVGAVYGLYVITTRSKGIKTALSGTIIIENITIENINNIDEGGDIIKEDAAGIYIVCTESEDLNRINKIKTIINNISATNYGKRCIKLDSLFSTVSNINASSNFISDTVVSCNSYGRTDRYEFLNNAHCSISNITFTGYTNYIVDTGLPNTYINNIYADTNGGWGAIKVHDWVSEINISNLFIKEIPIISFNDTNIPKYIPKINIKDVICTFTKCTFGNNIWHRPVLQYNTADVTINNLTINTTVGIIWDYNDIPNSNINYNGYEQGNLTIDGLTVVNNYDGEYVLVDNTLYTIITTEDNKYIEKYGKEYVIINDNIYTVNISEENKYIEIEGIQYNTQKFDFNKINSYFFDFNREINLKIKNFDIKTYCPSLIKSNNCRNLNLEHGKFESLNNIQKDQYSIVLDPIDINSNISISDLRIIKYVDLNKEVLINNSSNNDNTLIVSIDKSINQIDSNWKIINSFNPELNFLTLDRDVNLNDESRPKCMGYKILNPEQSLISQLTDSNTIYEIRYEFDLGGEEIEIPENCTLKFEGGKLSNGTLANLANAPIGDTTEILDNIIVKTPQIPIQMDWYVGARNNTDVVLNKIFEGAKDSTGQIVDITVKLDKGIYVFTDVISIDRAKRVYIEGAGIEQTTLLYDGENKENGTFFHLIHFAYGGFDGVKIDGNGKLTNGLILEDDGNSSPRSAYNNFGSIFFRRFHDSNGYCLILGNINSGLYQVSENIFDVVKTSDCVNGLYLTGQQTINNTINKWQEDTSYRENNTEGTTLTFGGGIINTINNVLSENNYCIHIIEAQNSAQIITLGNIYAENVKGFLRSTAINKGTAARSIAINNASVLLTEATVMHFSYSTVVDINNLTLRSNSANDYLITSATDFSGYARLQVGLLHKALASGSTLTIDDNIEYHNIFAGEHRCSKKGGTSPLLTLERTAYFNAPNAQLAFKTNGKTDGVMYGMSGYPGVIDFDVRNGYTDETVQSYRAHKYGLSTSSMFLAPTDDPTVPEAIQKYTYPYRIYVESNGLLKYSRYGDNAANVTLSDLNKKDGTTEERPTETYIGFQFFDTTLSKPIWWNGEEWIDSIKDRIAIINEDDTVNSLGYKTLSPNKSFKDQVTDSNTIYEIRYKFDLGGEKIEIPENCTLKFEGGSISNGTLKGKETIIGDNARFNGVNFDGTFVNKSIKISWFLSKEISHKDSYLQAASLAHLNSSWLDGENISLLFDGGVIISALNFKAKNLNISFTTNSDDESLFSYEGNGNLSNIENSEFWYLGDGAGGWHKGINVLSKNNWTDINSVIYRNIKWYYFTGYFYICKNYLQEAVFENITGFSGGGFINFNSEDKKGSANVVLFNNVSINAATNYNGVNGYPSRLYCNAEYLYDLYNCMELTFNNCVCQGRTGFVEKTAMQITSETATLSTSSIYLNGFWCEYDVSGDEKNVRRKIVVNANTDITILKNGLVAFDILDTSSVNIRFYANAPISLINLVNNITYSDSAKLSMDINCGLTNATYDKWTPTVMSKLTRMMEDGIIKTLKINNSAYYNSQTPRLNIDISLTELWDVKKTLIESITYPYIKNQNLRTSIKDVSNIPCLCIEHDTSLGYNYNTLSFPFKYIDFFAAKKNPVIMIDMIYRVTPLSAFGEGEEAFFSSDIFDPVKSEQYIYQCSESDAVGVPSGWMRVFGCYTFNTGESMTYGVHMSVKNCKVEIAKLDIAHNIAVINNTKCHIVDGNLVGVNPHETYNINTLTDDMSIFDTSAWLETKTAIYKKIGDSLQKFALISSSAKTLGTTTERPTGVSAGFQFFDTTLSKPIWWSGDKWVDCNGNEV